MRHMPSFRDLSIRRKLTLIVMITTCTAILLACGAFFAFDIHTLRQSRMHDLETLAEVLGSNSTAALTFNDPAAAREVLQSLSAKEHVMAAGLYRSDGAMFATYVRDAASAAFAFPGPESSRTRFEAKRLVVFHTIVLDGHRLGTVFLASDLGEFAELIRLYFALFGLIVVSLSVGAFFLAARMQRAISDPILMLAQTTRQVTSEKDFSLRATRGANDEVGVLIDGFNGMLTEIQRRDQDLQLARDELELRVEQRTAHTPPARFHGREHLWARSSGAMHVFKPGRIAIARVFRYQRASGPKHARPGAPYPPRWVTLRCVRMSYIRDP